MYEYFLDVHKQYELMPKTESMEAGLKDALEWYLSNPEKVNRKPYLTFIDSNLAL